MATTKRILGDYTIQSVGPSDKVNINTSLVTINGNLIVTGDSTSIDSTNTTIWDNVITLNAGTSPSSAPVLDAGIEVDRGTQANVQLRWKESYQKWQITNDGSTFGNIAFTSATGGTDISANLDLKSYTIYSSTGELVKIDDNIALQTTASAPMAQAGYNVIYSMAPAGGGSGLYVNNNSTASAELATQSAAIKYAIIFG